MVNTEYWCLRVGDLNENENFYKTFHIPIKNENIDDIRWAINEKSLNKKTFKLINNNIKTGNKIYIVLFPTAPHNTAYAICLLKCITERNLGPLLEIDETNEERGWDNETIHGNSDFTYDLKFSKIYLLNTKSFDGLKVKGQHTFFKLKVGKKNEELLNKITEEIKYIKRYVNPIILN